MMWSCIHGIRGLGGLSEIKGKVNEICDYANLL